MFARVPEGSGGVYLQRACLIIAGILVRPPVGSLKVCQKRLVKTCGTWQSSTWGRLLSAVVS